MASSEKRKVALVLGSGGARGLAHIGVIEAFEERGYEITSISGASIGSVIGGVYAAGSLPEYKKWILSLDRRKVFGLMDFTISSHGFIKGERVIEEMKQFVSVEHIEDLKIPFSAVAVDIENQEEVIFSEGNLWNAIRASVAIPSVLTPVMQDDRILVDGGVVNPLPVNRVKRTEGDLLAAVDLNALVDHPSNPSSNEVASDDAEHEQSKFLDSIRERIGDWWPFNGDKEEQQSHVKKNYLGILNASFEMMQDRVAQLAMEQYTPQIFIQVPRKSASTFDFYMGEKLIKMGKDLANEAIDKYENKGE